MEAALLFENCAMYGQSGFALSLFIRMLMGRLAQCYPSLSPTFSCSRFSFLLTVEFSYEWTRVWFGAICFASTMG